MASTRTADPGQFASTARQVVEDVLDDRLGASGQLLADIVPEFLRYLEQLQQRADTYVPTPIHKLNGLVVGWGPGEVAIVGARPETAKQLSP